MQALLLTLAICGADAPPTPTAEMYDRAIAARRAERREKIGTDRRRAALIRYHKRVLSSGIYRQNPVARKRYIDRVVRPQLAEPLYIRNARTGVLIAPVQGSLFKESK